MNKLIMGLCLIGILSAVRCDNESDKTPPALQKVNLSARQTDEGFKAIIEKGTAYVKLTITKNEAGNTYAKYYKEIQDENPKDVHDLKFPIQADGSIDEFFLESSESGNIYWVQQFDLYDKDPDGNPNGTLQYSLSEKKEFTLKTVDSDNNVIIDLIKNEPSDAGGSDLIKAPFFSIRKVKGYPFNVKLLMLMLIIIIQIFLKMQKMEIT